MDKKLKSELEDAILKLIKAVDDNPYDAQGYYNLGIALNESNAQTQAEELFKKALSIFKNQIKETELLEYGLGNTYYESSLYQEAIGEFVKIKGELKDDAMLMIGQSYFALEMYQKSLVYAITVLEKDDENMDALMLIADSFLAMGQLKQAKEYYLKVVQFDSQNKRALFQLGVICVSDSGSDEGYFDKVKSVDDKYYQKMIQRLSDVESFVLKYKKMEEK